MSHLLIAPILLPLFTALLLLLPSIAGNQTVRRAIALGSGLLQLLLAIALLLLSNKHALGYALGDWPAPFGIVLYLDRLTALMLLLTSVLAVASLAYSFAGEERQGAYYLPLMHLQLMGIQGAFLTGDIFNLFVFFEILLIASYSLLVHGGGKAKTKAALHYVVLNLVGSAVFLIALALLYATFGSLNMQHMSELYRQLSAEQLVMAKMAAMLLLVVFGLKSALLPLHFWLPASYAAAPAAVAALFAVMTKIGVYSMLRVYNLVFADGATTLLFDLQQWLMPLAALTMLVAIFGVLAAQDLRRFAAFVVLLSAGLLVAAVSLFSAKVTAATLFYLVHSTLAAAALILLVDMVSKVRGQANDRIVSARPVPQLALVGSLFIGLALAIVGMPPLSGFIGKVWLLKTVWQQGAGGWFWPLLLICSLLLLVAFSRAGSTVFWRSHGEPASSRYSAWQWAGVTWLSVWLVALVLAAGPISQYMQGAAEQVHQPRFALTPQLSSPALTSLIAEITANVDEGNVAADQAGGDHD